MAEVILDGKNIQTESDFHRVMAELLDFGPYYGRNLGALWDRLSTDLERPVSLVWIDSGVSEECLGAYFYEIIKIFEKVKQQDLMFDWAERFEYVLR